MKSDVLNLPAEQVAPVLPQRDEKLHCEIEKMRKNGKLVFYMYACHMVYPHHVITTFTENPNNTHAVAFQIVLGECAEELTKISRVRATQALDVVHLNDIEGIHHKVECGKILLTPTTCSTTIIPEADLVSINMNDSSVGHEQNLAWLDEAMECLRPNGLLILEIGSMHKREIQEMLWNTKLNFQEVRLVKPHATPGYLDTKYLLCLGRHNHPTIKALPADIPLDWYMYIITLENAYTSRKNNWQKKACELATVMIGDATGVGVDKIEARLKHLLARCLGDTNIRKFGTAYCREHRLL